ncbi:hypothetical protein K1719_010782 [Acacia pycnantha]|nr:hypothetical protein K1719_010782 [Acacia pycnantha]
MISLSEKNRKRKNGNGNRSRRVEKEAERGVFKPQRHSEEIYTRNSSQTDGSVSCPETIDEWKTPRTLLKLATKRASDVIRKEGVRKEADIGNTGETAQHVFDFDSRNFPVKTGLREFNKNIAQKAHSAVKGNLIFLFPEPKRKNKRVMILMNFFATPNIERDQSWSHTSSTLGDNSQNWTKPRYETLAEICRAGETKRLDDDAAGCGRPEKEKLKDGDHYLQMQYFKERRRVRGMDTQFNHTLFDRHPIIKSKTPVVKWVKEWSDDKQIGILSFEVANVMSKTLHLHKSLTESEISKLRNEILTSEDVNKLVSSDEAFLLELALAEKLEELNRVASVVSRLGKKCSEPALQGFDCASSFDFEDEAVIQWCNLNPTWH